MPMFDPFDSDRSREQLRCICGRHRSQAEIIAQVNQLLQQVPGIRVTTISGNSLGIRGGGNGLQFAVIGDDYASLDATAEKIATKPVRK